MTTRSIRSIPTYHWIPPAMLPAWKVIVTANGVEYDFSDQVVTLKIKNAATSELGSFEMEIYDPDLRYQGIFVGGEEVVYYADYASSATTARFKGYVEKPNYKEYKLNLSGRSSGKFLADRSVTKSHDNIQCDIILKDLIDSYGNGRFTYNGVDVSSVSISTNWYQKPFMDCVQELCTASGFDFYIDADDDAQFFEVGSRNNTEDAVVHGVNLYDTGDFADDLSQIRNRVIVYGAEQDGVQFIYTAEDLTSQAAYGVKEEIINDNNLTTYTQCQEYAEYKLDLLKNPPKIGEVTSFLLSTIQPGDMLLISDPLNNIQPGRYQVISYELDLVDYNTKINISKEPRKFSHIIKSLIDTTNMQAQTSLNPYEMRYSMVDLFESDTGTHTDTQIANGVLAPTSSTGTWTSDTRSLTSNITQAYLVMKAENINSVRVQFSGDNGAHWVDINNKQSVSSGTSIGTNLKVRIIFSSASASVDSYSLMYKLEGDGT